MKKLSKRKWIGIAAGGGAALAVICLLGSAALQVDVSRARQIALEQAGGGEIVAEEVSREGLWKEYNYVVVNGDHWYDLELNGFGMVTELERSSGGRHWD